MYRLYGQHDFSSDIGIAFSGDVFICVNRSTSFRATEASDDKVFPMKDGGELAARRPVFHRVVSILALTCLTLSKKKSHRSLTRCLCLVRQTMFRQKPYATVFQSRCELPLTLVTCSSMKKEHEFWISLLVLRQAAL